MRLSASKVDTYYGCKRLFFYRYLEPPFDPPPNKYFAIGNIAHEALDLFHKQTKKEEDQNRKYCAEVMKKCFKVAYDKYNAKQLKKEGVLAKSDLLDIKEMLSNYLKRLRTKWEFPNVRYVEEWLNLDLDGISVAGKVDRVDFKDEGYEVVDYKTSKKPLSKNDMLESVQLPTYVMWCAEKLNVPIDLITAKYVYLRLLGKRNEIKILTVDQASIDAAVSKYKLVDADLKNGTKFTRNRAYKYCFMCDFKFHCFSDKHN